MDTSIIYILIAVFALLSIIFVWIAAKVFIDMRKRHKARQARRNIGRPSRQERDGTPPTA